MRKESSSTGTNLFQIVAIDKISVDRSQPRKSFDEESIKELAQSVKEKGIIEPLIVREREHGLQIICGQRRYLAAQAVGLAEIPVIVRKVSDKEALELQLIENIQREDVHPMQQAVGFKLLIEKRQMDLEEIAKREGKSIYFIRQQLKLNDLIPKWQAFFLKRGISLSFAVQIASLSADAQNDLYQSEVTEEEEQSEHPYINLNSYSINKYKGLLAEANFDVNDAELDPSVGACVSCKFNSAFASLFPAEQLNPRCNNVMCFKNKSVIAFNKELHTAIEDPAVILVYESQTIPDIVQHLKTEGREVLQLGYGEECRQVRCPQKPVLSQSEKQHNLTKKEEKRRKAELTKAEKEYKLNFASFEEGVATGKYKKAFVVFASNDSRMGRYIYVELTPKKNARKVNAGNKSSLEEIDEEITRIQQRELRAKEIDQEKVFRKIVDAMKSLKSTDLQKSNLMDAVLINFLLLEHLSFHCRNEIQKVIKSPALWNANNGKKLREALRSLSKYQISQLVKTILIDKYRNSLSNSRGGIVFRVMAESLGNISIAAFENEQKEIAVKRQNRVIEQINQLKAISAGLKNSKKHRCP